MPAAGILGWKRSKYYRSILHNSKSLETSRKSISEYIINTERKKFTRGAHPSHEGGGHALPPGGAHCLVGPLLALRCPSSAI